jgi:hypothetical protein
LQVFPLNSFEQFLSGIKEFNRKNCTQTGLKIKKVFIFGRLSGLALFELQAHTPNLFEKHGTENSIRNQRTRAHILMG